MRNHFKVQGTRYKVQSTFHLSPFTFHLSRQRGFTLVEMIVVMVITGILGGMVAMFIKAPVQGYVDSARRAAMVDIADTALRRLARDIRTAVPNSVRVGGSTYIEFLPTKDGGRYRASPATAGTVYCGSYAAAVLDFGAADTCFEIIGTPIIFSNVAGNVDQIVIGSTQSDGNPPYVTTVLGVLRAYTGGAGSQPSVAMAGAAQFPAFAEVQGQRFDVVPGDQQAVTYACENVAAAPAGGDGPGTLRRYWRYGFNATQVAPPLGGQSAILADKVSDCNIVYDAVNQRNGLVAIRLGITRGGESISLYHQVHVNNVP